MTLKGHTCVYQFTTFYYNRIPLLLFLLTPDPRQPTLLIPPNITCHNAEIACQRDIVTVVNIKLEWALKILLLCQFKSYQKQTWSESIYLVTSQLKNLLIFNMI